MNEQAETPIHPLNAISEQFKSSDTGSDRGDDRQPSDVETTAPSLSLLKLSSPAILIDQTLQVIWQNSAACKVLWHIDDAPPFSSQTQSIFDLLFKKGVFEQTDRWTEWLVFFLVQARQLTSVQEVGRQIEDLQDEQRQIVQAALNGLEKRIGSQRFTGNAYGTLQDGHGAVFDAVVTRFESNTLMVFEARHAVGVGPGVMSAREDSRRSELAQSPSQAAKSEISVLSAELNDAGTLRAEMLDEEFSRLFLRVWETTAETIEAFGGVVSQSSGTGILGYFLPGDNNGNRSLGAIQCALELKRKMSELGREWKIRKGWLHDIELNMGIHTGVEYMASVPTIMGDHLLTLGETLDVAKHLSQIASGGQIWTTKTLIHRVPESELKSLRFGIFRSDSHRQMFVARCFSRIRDLASAESPALNLDEEMGACAVTQVFDRQGHG